MWVERTDLPCPACWQGVLLTVRPSCAYRFSHPDRRANLVDGQPGLLSPDEWEEECLSRTWPPIGPTRRPVQWPMTTDMWSAWWIDTDVFPDARPYRDRWEANGDGADDDVA